MWTKKSLLLSVCLLLLLSWQVSSDTFQDPPMEDYLQLLTIFDRLDEKIKYLEISLAEREIELSNLKALQEIENEKYKSLRISYENESQLLIDLQKDYQEIKIRLETSETLRLQAEQSLSDSLKTQRKKIIKNSITAFIVGGIVGAILGFIVD